MSKYHAPILNVHSKQAHLLAYSYISGCQKTKKISTALRRPPFLFFLTAFFFWYYKGRLLLLCPPLPVSFRRASAYTPQQSGSPLCVQPGTPAVRFRSPPPICGARLGTAFNYTGRGGSPSEYQILPACLAISWLAVGWVDGIYIC